MTRALLPCCPVALLPAPFRALIHQIAGGTASSLCPSAPIQRKLSAFRKLTLGILRAGVLLLAFAASRSLAHTTDTWLFDSGTTLNVSGQTILGWSGESHDCQMLIEGGYYCYGSENTAVRVDTRLLAPGMWQVQNSQSIDDTHAEVYFSYYPPNAGGQWWGWWWAESDHYVQVDEYQYYCLDYHFECSCPSGFPYPCGTSQFWQFLGQTSEGAFVYPPPPPPGPVHVEYVMFIPFDHVRLPGTVWSSGTFFEGDNQPTYSPTGTYRIRQSFVINTASKTVGSVSNLGSNSVGYAPPMNFLSPWPMCYRKDCQDCPQYGSGQLIVFDGYCQDVFMDWTCAAQPGNMGSMTVSVTDDQTPNSVEVTFSGDPNNGCISGSPGITWQNRITISWSDSPASYVLEMDHDGFPMHEVRINGVLVYSHDPHPTYTPWHLAQPPEIQFSSGNQQLP